MKGKLKKLLLAILVLCLFITPLASVPAYAVEEDYGIMPILNNTSTVTANGSVTNNGLLTVNYSYTGYQGITTKAVITTTIEKRHLLFFWKTVEINGQDEWSFTVNDFRYTGYKRFQLPSTGTYRVNTTFKIYGSGGSADVIDAPFEIDY